MTKVRIAAEKKNRKSIFCFLYLKHQLVSKNSCEKLCFDRCELFVKFQNLWPNQIRDLHYWSKVPLRTFKKCKQTADNKCKQKNYKNKQTHLPVNDGHWSNNTEIYIHIMATIDPTYRYIMKIPWKNKHKSMLYKIKWVFSSQYVEKLELNLIFSPISV